MPPLWGTEVQMEVHGMQPGFYWVKYQGDRTIALLEYVDEEACWYFAGSDQPYATSDLQVGPRVRGQEERT